MSEFPYISLRRESELIYAKGMPRSTRNSQNTSILTDEALIETNMVAKKKLTLQDVVDQMKQSIDQLETKLEIKIDENAEKVPASLKLSEGKLGTIDKNTTD